MSEKKPRTCAAAADRGFLGIGGPRCGKPATHVTLLGDRCEDCAEVARAAFRNPNTLGNVLAGRARTDVEIARMVRPIVPEEELS